MKAKYDAYNSWVSFFIVTCETLITGGIVLSVVSHYGRYAMAQDIAGTAPAGHTDGDALLLRIGHAGWCGTLPA